MLTHREVHPRSPVEWGPVRTLPDARACCHGRGAHREADLVYEPGCGYWLLYLRPPEGAPSAEAYPCPVGRTLTAAQLEAGRALEPSEAALPGGAG